MRSFLVFIFIIITFNLLSQVNKQNIEKLKTKTYEEIEYANKLLEETKGRKKESLEEIDLINDKLNSRKIYLNALNNEIQEIKLAIQENENSINNFEENIKSISNDYAKAIYNAYKNKRNNYFIMYLLESDNFNQAYKRIRYLQLYNNFRRRQIEKLVELKQNLKVKNTDLQLLLKRKLITSKLTENENLKILKDIEQKNILLTSLKKKESDILKEIEEKKRIAKKLESELEKIILAERKKSNKSTLIESLTPEERHLSDEFELNKGKLPWPTEKGIITGQYGEHEHPDYKGVKIRNDGIYISTTAGSEVRSIFKGIVSKVFSIPGENYTVIIRHGNYFTLYHNLRDVRVKAGQNVNTKDIIGTIFTNDDTKESILYFQVWKEIEKSDPEIWLSH